MHIYKVLSKFCKDDLKILSRNNILRSIQVHNSITNKQKMAYNNPNLDLVNINAYSKIGEILSISQNVKRK